MVISMHVFFLLLKNPLGGSGGVWGLGLWIRKYEGPCYGKDLTMIAAALYTRRRLFENPYLTTIQKLCVC